MRWERRHRRKRPRRTPACGSQIKQVVTILTNLTKTTPQRAAGRQPSVSTRVAQNVIHHSVQSAIRNVTRRADALPLAIGAVQTRYWQATAVRDATESPAGIDAQTAAIGLLPKQAPEAAGRSAALSSSVHRESKFREDRQGSY